MKLNILYFSSVQNLVTLCAEGTEISLSWQEFEKIFPDVFSVDQVINFNYEVERNLFVVERPGQVTTGLDQLEMQWINQRFEKIKEELLLYRRKQDVYTAKQYRDEMFYSTNWLVERHSEEKELGIQSTLSEEQYNSLLLYRQELREMGDVFDMSQHYETIEWPERPFNEQ